MKIEAEYSVNFSLITLVDSDSSGTDPLHESHLVLTKSCLKGRVCVCAKTLEILYFLQSPDKIDWLNKKLSKAKSSLRSQ